MLFTDSAVTLPATANTAAMIESHNHKASRAGYIHATSSVGPLFVLTSALRPDVMPRSLPSGAPLPPSLPEARRCVSQQYPVKATTSIAGISCELRRPFRLHVFQCGKWTRYSQWHQLAMSR